MRRVLAIAAHLSVSTASPWRSFAFYPMSDSAKGIGSTLASSLCCFTTNTDSVDDTPTKKAKIETMLDVLKDFTSRPAQKVLVPPGKCQFTSEFKSVKLLQKAKVNHNTSLFRFACPNTEEPLNLSTCACILAKARLPTISEEKKDEDVLEDVIRPYTPISTNAQIGSFDLLVKHYPDGKMSQHLKNMKEGEELEFKHIQFNVKIQAPFKAKHIGMIVGGTGVTPMIQAIHAILGDKASGTKVTMLYGSRSADDILGKQLLDEWAKKYPERLEVVHVLSNEPKESLWDGARGFISKEMIQSKFGAPSLGEDVLIFVCGPPPMYKAFCGARDDKELSGILADVGYNPQQVFKF